MANGKGRHRSRLHVRFGERGVKKLCVSVPFTDECKAEVVGLIEAYLERTKPQPGRKRLANPDSHSTSVKFLLGQGGQDLGIQSVTVSLADLRTGRTQKLFSRLDEARNAAIAKLDPPQSMAAE